MSAARILIIEDQLTNLELMDYLLQVHGYVLLTARDGLEGIEIVSREKPDLIICDIQMPRMDGYGVARSLNSSAEHSDIPLVAVTALAMVGDRDRILAAGFDGYIAKPITPQTFVEEVEAFLRPEQRSHKPIQTSVSPAEESGIRTSAVEAARGENRGTILLVDNSPGNLELFRSILEPSGYRTMSATSGREALSLARQKRPDLILSDVHMPDVNGPELVEALSADAELSSIPVCLTSNATPQEATHKFNLSSRVRFLPRPFDVSAFLSEVEACLRPSPDGAEPLPSE